MKKIQVFGAAIVAALLFAVPSASFADTYQASCSEILSGSVYVVPGACPTAPSIVQTSPVFSTNSTSNAVVFNNPTTAGDEVILYVSAFYQTASSVTTPGTLIESQTWYGGGSYQAAYVIPITAQNAGTTYSVAYTASHTNSVVAVEVAYSGIPTIYSQSNAYNATSITSAAVTPAVNNSLPLALFSANLSETIGGIGAGWNPIASSSTAVSLSLQSGALTTTLSPISTGATVGAASVLGSTVILLPPNQ